MRILEGVELPGSCPLKLSNIKVTSRLAPICLPSHPCLLICVRLTTRMLDMYIFQIYVCFPIYQRGPLPVPVALVQTTTVILCLLFLSPSYSCVAKDPSGKRW